MTPFSNVTSSMISQVTNPMVCGHAKNPQMVALLLSVITNGLDSQHLQPLNRELPAVATLVKDYKTPIYACKSE
jgi:maltose-binding protein MalE